MSFNLNVKPLFRITTLTFFGMLFHSSLTGQILHYEVVKGGKSIGTVEVSRTVSDGLEIYRLKNVVEFKMIFTFTVEYALKETFKNDMLWAGEGYNSLNGSIQKETKIEFKDGQYHLLIDGIKGYVEEDDTIRYSVSQVYHVEPEPGQEVYSEYFGRYLQFVKIGDHKYSLESPDGENQYTYEYGYCTRIDVSRDYASFSIEMKPESLAAVRKNSSSLPDSD